ncbi:hypothetical protein FRC02_001172 [Tulasnella sp. 418]|nr:hypothetical protein FRC02_001172 [Tulasnella sp. 418]
MSSGATFGELTSSVARLSAPSLPYVPLDDSSSSDARSLISDSTPSSPNLQDIDEDIRPLETCSMPESTEMVYRDRYDGLFAPSLLVDPATVEPAPPIPSRLLSSPSVFCKDREEHEIPGRGGRMGRRIRMKYLAPKDDGFPERPT